MKSSEHMDVTMCLEHRSQAIFMFCYLYVPKLPLCLGPLASLNAFLCHSVSVFLGPGFHSSKKERSWVLPWGTDATEPRVRRAENDPGAPVNHKQKAHVF